MLYLSGQKPPRLHMQDGNPDVAQPKKREPKTEPPTTDFANKIRTWGDNRLVTYLATLITQKEIKNREELEKRFPALMNEIQGRKNSEKYLQLLFVPEEIANLEADIIASIGIMKRIGKESIKPSKNKVIEFETAARGYYDDYDDLKIKIQTNYIDYNANKQKLPQLYVAILNVIELEGEIKKVKDSIVNQPNARIMITPIVKTRLPRIGVIRTALVVTTCIGLTALLYANNIFFDAAQLAARYTPWPVDSIKIGMMVIVYGSATCTIIDSIITALRNIYERKRVQKKQAKKEQQKHSEMHEYVAFYLNEVNRELGYHVSLKKTGLYSEPTSDRQAVENLKTSYKNAMTQDHYLFYYLEYIEKDRKQIERLAMEVSVPIPILRKILADAETEVIGQFLSEIERELKEKGYPNLEQDSMKDILHGICTKTPLAHVKLGELFKVSGGRYRNIAKRNQFNGIIINNKPILEVIEREYLEFKETFDPMGGTQ